MRAINCLVIHHSASKNDDVDSIRAGHKKRGFADIGYHNVIGNGVKLPDGHISAARPHEKIGAGVFGANTGKLQVCLIGNFESTVEGHTGPPSEAQLNALGHWLHTNMRRYGVPAAQVKGHKEVSIPGHGTLCPGNRTPLNLIRAWCAQERENEAPTVGLHAYLLAHGWTP